jgi:hypothetical protein
MTPPPLPLWDTVVDRSPSVLAAAGVGLGAAAVWIDWAGGAGAPPLYAGALVLAALLARALTTVTLRPSWGVVYHSDDDGLLVAPVSGRVVRLPWPAVIEMRENFWGSVSLVTREASVRLPRRIARRDGFGLAAFERVVPRLAGELWEGLANGRMVVVTGERYRAVVVLVLCLALAASVMLPASLVWGAGLLATGIVVLAVVRTRTRSVFMSARGIGDRDQFIGWESAELSEGRWWLVVRDADAGWVARIPRSAVNYHAIAVVARTAQALSGSGVDSVAFRSAHDGRGVRIVVEGTRSGGPSVH